MTVKRTGQTEFRNAIFVHFVDMRKINEHQERCRRPTNGRQIMNRYNLVYRAKFNKRYPYTNYFIFILNTVTRSSGPPIVQSISSFIFCI